MNKIDSGFGGVPDAPDEVQRVSEGARLVEYTAADFLKHSGKIVAVCLGLALLAQILVKLVGQ